MSNVLTEFPATLAARQAELEATRNSLLELTKDGVDTKPASGWSVSEIVYHLYIVEKGITGMLQKALASTEQGERKSDEDLKIEWQTIVGFAANREEKVQAPSVVEPNNAPSLSESLELIKESRTALSELINNTTLDQLACVSRPHLVKEAGLISGPGWLTLIARHELRHVEQLKELKQ
ncbi:MAG: DinB family protein [Blastocatellia bacterium]